ncbi:MAG: MaoC family dehydratase [Lachnospiraceae bacterium]|nr:MaoC family dehydratase [Lachnospiraceae bacterium]
MGELEVELKPGKTDLFYIYMELVSSFSRIEGFSGWRIAKAEFKIEKAKCFINKTSIDDKAEISRKFVKQRKNYSVISACTTYKNLEYTVIMYIVKPYVISNKNRDIINKTDNMPEPGRQGFNYLFALKYKTEDIKRFTEFTGDNNPLHQTVTPVVPGFMMFGDITRKELYKYIDGNSQVKFVIYFRNPVFADEILEVYMEAGTGKIIAVQADRYKDIKKTCYKWEVEII